MKMLHVADIHLDNTLGTRYDEETKLNLRTLDYFRSFDLLIGYAIENKIDVLLIVGDIFKTSQPSNIIQKEFLKRLMRLEDCQLHTIILTGNHDVPTSKYNDHALSIYKHMGLNYIHIIDQPCVGGVPMGDTVFGFIPSMYGFKDNSVPYNTLVDKIVDQMRQEASARGLKNLVLSSHVCLLGSKIKESLSLDKGVDPNVFIKHSDLHYIALGDIHKYQVFNEKPLIVYPGSIERVTFNEENDPKGFVIVDINDGKVTYKFEALPSREYKTLSCDITKLDAPVAKIAIDVPVKDKVIRLRVKRRDNQTFIVPEALQQSFYYTIEEDLASENNINETKFAELNTNNLVKEYMNSVLKLNEETQNRINVKAKELQEANSKQIMARYDNK